MHLPQNEQLYKYMYTSEGIHVNSTHKQLEAHRCIVSTAATDGLVLKHQAIMFYYADSNKVFEHFKAIIKQISVCIFP